MPLYYLFVRSNEDLIRDDEGEEFGSFDDARREAIECAREIAAERLKLGRPLNTESSCVEIYDEDGALKCRVPFAAVYRV